MKATVIRSRFSEAMRQYIGMVKMDQKIAALEELTTAQPAAPKVCLAPADP